MAIRKKRKHPRTQAKGLSVLLPHAGGVTPCNAEDISLGGCFIRTNEQFLPGTQLSISLVRPGMSKGLKVLATVANLRTPAAGKTAGLGVRFDVLTDETRTRLSSLLHEFGVPNPEAEEEDVKYAALEPEAVDSGDFEPYGADGSHLAMGRPFLAAAAQDSDPDADSLSDVSLSMERDAAVPKVPPASLRAPALPDPVPDLMDKLQAQIRGLILQLGAVEQRLATKDSEIAALRSRVSELESLLGKRDLELARLKAETKR